MNDAKHTKGPWEVGEWITSQSHAVYKLIHGVGRNVSAVCVYGARKDGTKSGKRNVSVEECDANARLIAAAPDLLAACEARIDEWHADSRNFTRNEPPSLTLMRAAIRKAEGK